MTELQDFVKQTLLQITTGVKQAQAALSAEDGEINPPASGNTAMADSYPISHRRVAHQIELDIAVVADENGVTVAAGNSDASCVSRIRFKIGVAFPTTEAEHQESSTKTTSFELEV